MPTKIRSKITLTKNRKMKNSKCLSWIMKKRFCIINIRDGNARTGSIRFPRRMQSACCVMNNINWNKWTWKLVLTLNASGEAARKTKETRSIWEFIWKFHEFFSLLLIEIVIRNSHKDPTNPTGDQQAYDIFISIISFECWIIFVVFLLHFEFIVLN